MACKHEKLHGVPGGWLCSECGGCFDSLEAAARDAIKDMKIGVASRAVVTLQGGGATVALHFPATYGEPDFGIGPCCGHLSVRRDDDGIVEITCSPKWSLATYRMAPNIATEFAEAILRAANPRLKG